MDAAITPFPPAQWDLLDFEPITEHLFASGERMHSASIGVGDEITAIGVFTRFSYEDRHMPLVKTGNLAMLPAVHIPVKNFEQFRRKLSRGESTLPYVLPQCWPLLKGVKCSPSL